ncbi:MAG: hypothetical protein ACLT98_09140 [Eggerthellaceae bacterium]
MVTNSTSVMMHRGGRPELYRLYLARLAQRHREGGRNRRRGAFRRRRQGRTHKVARPFNVVAGKTVSDVAQDFLDFVMSAEGQAVVDEDYVSVAENAQPYSASGRSGKVVVAGSSSVTPVMEKLADAY